MKILARFFALGALLFAAQLLVTGALPVRGTIVVDAAEVARLRSEWRAETRREPTPDQLAAAVRRRADEELLVREALRLGLERTDPVVRDRLVRNLRFVQTGGDDAALFEQALALGMATQDLVVRRRLIQAMERRLAAGVDVDEAGVRDYVARHAERYAAPRRVSFRHEYLDAAGRAAAFPLGSRFRAMPEDQVARLFGAGFAAALLRLPAGEWATARSAYGVHRVFVEDVVPPAVPDFEAVRDAARWALIEEREREAVRHAMAGLRRRYALRVDWPQDAAS